MSNLGFFFLIFYGFYQWYITVRPPLGEYVCHFFQNHLFQANQRHRGKNQIGMVKKPHSRNRTKIETEWINAGYVIQMFFFCGSKIWRLHQLQKSMAFFICRDLTSCWLVLFIPPSCRCTGFFVGSMGIKGAPKQTPNATLLGRKYCMIKAIVRCLITP